MSAGPITVHLAYFVECVECLVSVLVLEFVRMYEEGLLTIVTLDVCLESCVRNVKNVVWADLLAMRRFRAAPAYLSLNDFMILSTCIISLRIPTRECEQLTSAVPWTSLALFRSIASASDILAPGFRE
jgi:hypothetical protein